MGDKGLGKGLDALLPESDAEDDSLRRIPVEQIEADPNQPRKHFDPDRLDELTQSIKQQGLVEPVVVRPREDGDYVLVAGERRWRAACQAEMERIPAMVRDLSSDDALTISLVENIQRENLTPVEEAMAYQRLCEQHDWSQQELADNVGRSRSAVANTLRLLKLPDEVLDHLNDGSISSGHARALLGLDDEEAMREVFERITNQSLSVRETEQLIQQWPPDSPSEKSDTASSPEPTADFSQLEAEMEDHVGAEVTIESKDRKEGHIKIHFNNPDEFDAIRERLSEVT